MKPQTKLVIPAAAMAASKGTTVRLPKKLWDQIDEALEFEKDLRRTAELEGAVKLNDMLGYLLEWALWAYWEQEGGKPKGSEERKQKIRESIERRLKSGLEEARGESKGSQQ